MSSAPQQLLVLVERASGQVLLHVLKHHTRVLSAYHSVEYYRHAMSTPSSCHSHTICTPPALERPLGMQVMIHVRSSEASLTTLPGLAISIRHKELGPPSNPNPKSDTRLFQTLTLTLTLTLV